MLAGKGHSFNASIVHRFLLQGCDVVLALWSLCQERELVLEMLRADAQAIRAEHDRALQHAQVGGYAHTCAPPMHLLHSCMSEEDFVHTVQGAWSRLRGVMWLCCVRRPTRQWWRA
jgi:hypothetical protein